MGFLLRHVNNASHFKRDGTEIKQVKIQAFYCSAGESGFSLTEELAALAFEGGLQGYQSAIYLNGRGDKPGLCKITEEVLADLGLSLNKTEGGDRHPLPDNHFEASCIWTKARVEPMDESKSLVGKEPPVEVRQQLLRLCKDAEMNGLFVDYIKGAGIVTGEG